MSGIDIQYDFNQLKNIQLFTLLKIKIAPPAQL